ncbi:hypothetical protein Taro_042506 [Colocasia esculenta]|uniref:Uncharacterized protein n=1 Tax=Colocasia esculenta TaxID=4460 RepID=A0A843X2Q9_COLES|nr:hypothetical protein [Colocasia esculenta]
MALQGKNGGALGYVGTRLERAIEEYLQQISDVPEEIRPLITKLNRIIAVMKDAEQMTISSHEVRFWLQGSKQILLDAEDLFDELATDAAVQKMRAHTQSSIGLIQTIVRRLPLFPAIPTVTRAMRCRIQMVNDRLDLLAPETPIILPQIAAAPVSCTRLTCPDTSSLLPDAVMGRHREKEQIIKMLTDRSDESSSNIKGFSIVPIVGLGGIGKTTLAQLVYNDEKVKKHFELRMWVCVSNDFDLRRLTKDITEAALAFKGVYEQCQVNNWDSVQRRLLQEVKGKTFLLVLDDVWEAEHPKWEALFKPLCSGKKGSKVLVTARNRAFVNNLGGRMVAPIPLGGLSDTDIWDVCKKYAFRGNMDSDRTTSTEYSHLEDLGWCIVQRLKGSPLAARTMGSLLNRELSEQHWKTVLESEFWKLEQGEDDILPALLVSYQYLSADLKQCFAYCSLFLKDHMFFNKEVVQLWEAQSFIKKDRGTRMDMIGSKYVDELLCMSFFEPPPIQSDGNDHYVMHDLIHDLAEYVSRDDCFRLEDQKLGETPDTTVRHVSVRIARRDQIYMINKLCFYEKLRTLLFGRSYKLGYHDLDQLFLKLKRLRVLGLSECGIEELPTSIGDLKHLRYLDLRCNDDLKRLPESLGNLYNLQVLNLKYCHSLFVLPSTMSQLVNLKHLQLTDHGLLCHIDGVGKLTGFQELQVRGRQLRELEGMCMLRELTITNLEEVGSKEEAIQARLQGKECLQVLHLQWSPRWLWSMNQDSIKPELEEVLQALRPNKGIRELHIQGYGGSTSPDWMEVPTLLSSFSSLRRVSLKDCANWQVLPCSFLGQLRHLKYLEIDQMPEWEEWNCPVSWDCLRKLTISDCRKLKELPLLPRVLRRLQLVKVGISCLHSELDGCSRVEGGVETMSSPHSPSTSASLSMLHILFCDNLTSISGLLQQQLPDLVLIEIGYCQNLVSLPEKGLGHLVSLKRLKITECPKLTCLLPMQKEEEDASTQHLPCSLEELQISQCGDAMGGWWWIGLQRLTSIAKLSLCGCPTTIELLFDRLKRNPHPHLSATLRGLLIKGYNKFDLGQQSATSSACSSQLSPPPTLPPIPHNNVDASSGILQAFTSLEELTIRESQNFLQKWGGRVPPSSLERLTVAGDDDLSQEDLSAWWHNLISLKQLTLENLSALPNLGGIRALETLTISSCPSINTLEAMSLPTSLKTLEISDCPSIQSWPASGLPSSLNYLKITACPALTGRHKDKPKSMWPEPVSDLLHAIVASQIQRNADRHNVERTCTCIMSIGADGEEWVLRNATGNLIINIVLSLPVLKQRRWPFLMVSMFVPSMATSICKLTVELLHPGWALLQGVLLAHGSFFLLCGGILHISSSLQISFRHVFREANHVANALANVACFIPSFVVWTCWAELPLDVKGR